MSKSIIIALLLTISTGSSWITIPQEPVADCEIALPKVLSNGMILQRNKPIPFWGKSNPGAAIRVTFAGTTRTVTSDNEGNWQVLFPAMEAGGPYTLEINNTVLQDILIGEVWLFSGQSNVELPISRVAIKYPEIATTYSNTQIREFRTTTHYDFKGPLEDVHQGRWKICTQEEIQSFSALGFFFAKELHETKNVPVGVIVNAVGGSPLDAWVDEATLRGMPGPAGKSHYPDLLDDLKRDTWVDSVKKAQTEALERYRSLFTRDPGPSGYGEWVPYHVPSFWNGPNATPEGPLSQGPGSVWFKKKIQLNKAQIDKAAAGAPDRDGMLLLGTMVDADRTYVNGTQVGSTGYQYPPRIYSIPKGLLKEGSNELLVRLENFWGPGGFTSEKDYSLYIGVAHPFYDNADTVSLAGDGWLALTGSKLPAEYKHVPYPSATTWHYQPSGLYNALLAPLTAVPVKGVIWYQGESATDRRNYDEMLCAMIDTWRADWKDEDMPFIIVQLPEFMKDTGPWPVETDWACRRDEQRRAALARDHTALVVGLGLGEWNDVHPLNKKDLAQRVFFAAEFLAYKNDKAPLSPVPEKATLKGNKVVITFSHSGKGLETKDGHPLQHFAVAGADGRFVRAEARITGKNSIAVWAPGIEKPQRIRYAWANDPKEANLQNRAGMPASPFEWMLDQ
jgi:sialate O-acetylesterase